MRHLGGRNRFPTEGVRALSSGGLLPGAAERKTGGHFLLGAVCDELGVIYSSISRGSVRALPDA